MSLQLVFKAVFLLLLTSTAQSATCASGPDKTGPTFTCGIKWTLTLSSSTTLTRAEGTMVTSGESTGILLENEFGLLTYFKGDF